jgi:hypothetical protein
MMVTLKQIESHYKKEIAAALKDKTLEPTWPIDESDVKLGPLPEKFRKLYLLINSFYKRLGENVNAAVALPEQQQLEVGLEAAALHYEINMLVSAFTYLVRSDFAAVEKNPENSIWFKQTIVVKDNYELVYVKPQVLQLVGWEPSTGDELPTDPELPPTDKKKLN